MREMKIHNQPPVLPHLWMTPLLVWQSLETSTHSLNKQPLRRWLSSLSWLVLSTSRCSSSPLSTSRSTLLDRFSQSWMCILWGKLLIGWTGFRWTSCWFASLSIQLTGMSLKAVSLFKTDSTNTWICKLLEYSSLKTLSLSCSSLNSSPPPSLTPSWMAKMCLSTTSLSPTLAISSMRLSTSPLISTLLSWQRWTPTRRSSLMAICRFRHYTSIQVLLIVQRMKSSRCTLLFKMETKNWDSLQSRRATSTRESQKRTPSRISSPLR